MSFNDVDDTLEEYFRQMLEEGSDAAAAHNNEAEAQASSAPKEETETLEAAPAAQTETALEESAPEDITEVSAVSAENEQSADTEAAIQSESQDVTESAALEDSALSAGDEPEAAALGSDDAMAQADGCVEEPEALEAQSAEVASVEASDAESVSQECTDEAAPQSGDISSEPDTENLEAASSEAEASQEETVPEAVQSESSEEMSQDDLATMQMLEAQGESAEDTAAEDTGAELSEADADEKATLEMLKAQGESAEDTAAGDTGAELSEADADEKATLEMLKAQEEAEQSQSSEEASSENECVLEVEPQLSVDIRAEETPSDAAKQAAAAITAPEEDIDYASDDYVPKPLTEDSEILSPKLIREELQPEPLPFAEQKSLETLLEAVPKTQVQTAAAVEVKEETEVKQETVVADTHEAEAQKVEETPSNPYEWSNIEMPDDFQVLFFLVKGIRFAVPLVNLGGIIECEKVTPLFGKPDWFQGIADVRGRKMAVVDTLKWVKSDAPKSEKYDYMIMLDDTLWSIGCDTLEGNRILNKDNITWRQTAGNRPWLAGIVKEEMCALLHVEALVKMFENGVNLKDIEAQMSA